MTTPRIVLFLFPLLLVGCVRHTVNNGVKNDKVRVCHKDKHELEIAASALSAHLKHGDRLGSCQSSYISTGATTKYPGTNGRLPSRPTF